MIPQDSRAEWRRRAARSQPSRTRARPRTARFFRASFSPVRNPAGGAASQLKIDLGADAVIASGAHELQSIEVRDGRPIVHNAGTLLFNFPEPDESVSSSLTLGPSGVEQIRTVPLTLEHDWTRQATAVEGDKILGAIDARSRGFATAITRGRIDLAPPSREPPGGEAVNLA